MGDRYLVVFDTPSIKQYVFGTDTLREIRGASANLDRLNRLATSRVLERELPRASKVDEIYANGGSAQFVVEDVDEADVRMACQAVIAHFMKETDGDVFPVYGVAELREERAYRESLYLAHLELRARREMTGETRMTTLMPIMAECSSASHLPATRMVVSEKGSRRALSESSQIKERLGRLTREHGIWAEWMQHCGKLGHWPNADGWDRLRCETITEIGEFSSGRVHGDIGLVYADGNAMGRVVQQLDNRNVCRAFSRIVDGNLREACFESLARVCKDEVEAVRSADSQQDLPRLPADILLLGGDDLLVLLPADRALSFAEAVVDRFEERTQSVLERVEDAEVRGFFQRLEVTQFSISCGVAIARSNYPFYLLLDLAEELLKSAKRANVDGPSHSPAGPHIDFHIVSGANSFSLAQTRSSDYRCHSDCARTLRPLTVSQLRALRESVVGLRRVRFPRSKLHALHQAALLESSVQAKRVIRDLFSRCKATGLRNERRALWDAVQGLCPDGWVCDAETFPEFQRGDRRILAVADLVEAADIL